MVEYGDAIDVDFEDTVTLVLRWYKNWREQNFRYHSFAYKYYTEECNNVRFSCYLLPKRNSNL